MPSSLLGFFLKYADKLRADDLALLLRVGNAGQLVQEAVHRVHINEVGIHLIRGTPRMTCSGSPLRSRPWLTCTQVSCLPMALMSSAATTEESTPPDRASRTFLSPTCSPDEIDLVSNEVLHVPVGLGMAGAEDEIQRWPASRAASSAGQADAALMIGQMQHGRPQS